MKPVKDINKIKNSELKALSVAISGTYGIPMTGKLSMAVTESVDLLSKALRVVDDARLVLLKGYSELDVNKQLKKTPEGKAVFKSKDDEAKFHEEYNKMLDQPSTFSFPKVKGVTKEYLSSIDDITPSQISVLLKFI